MVPPYKSGGPPVSGSEGHSDHSGGVRLHSQVTSPPAFSRTAGTKSFSQKLLKFANFKCVPTLNTIPLNTELFAFQKNQKHFHLLLHHITMSNTHVKLDITYEH